MLVVVGKLLSKMIHTALIVFYSFYQTSYTSVNGKGKVQNQYTFTLEVNARRRRPLGTDARMALFLRKIIRLDGTTGSEDRTEQ